MKKSRLEQITDPYASGTDIIVNNVPTPPFPAPPTSAQPSATKSSPTPANKRVLDQKEFDRKLKAKRALFSKGRSISLASFKFPTRHRPDKTDKADRAAQKSAKRKLSEDKYERVEEQGVRGELELLGIEQLINIHDLDDHVDVS